MVWSNWGLCYVNDPDDDFNIVIEVLYGERDVALMTCDFCGIMRWHPNKEGVDIPIDYLLELIHKSKEEFGRPDPWTCPCDERASNKEKITKRWTCRFTYNLYADLDVIIKVFCDDEHVTSAKTGELGGVIMQIYPRKESLDIPIEFPSELINKAIGKFG
ncbi:MAG: hypothetical protein FWE21_07270 [Defluviitaleaceae bacterium]|nr:hypothetical protein [Defluviitaleaceae bacterium]